MSDEFVAGSVIVCASCYHPIYALERGLGAWDRAGRAAGAFRPLRDDDIRDLLMDRPDVPQPWQRFVKVWWASEESYRTKHAQRPRSGDDTICPHCGGIWVKFEPRDGNAQHERGYKLILLDIPPLPARRGHMRKPQWVADVDMSAYELEIEERPLVQH